MATTNERKPSRAANSAEWKKELLSTAKVLSSSSSDGEDFDELLPSTTLSQSPARHLAPPAASARPPAPNRTKPAPPPTTARRNPPAPPSSIASSKQLPVDSLLTPDPSSPELEQEVVPARAASGSKSGGPSGSNRTAGAGYRAGTGKASTSAVTTTTSPPTRHTSHGGGLKFKSELLTPSSPHRRPRPPIAGGTPTASTSKVPSQPTVPTPQVKKEHSSPSGSGKLVWKREMVLPSSETRSGRPSRRDLTARAAAGAAGAVGGVKKEEETTVGQQKKRKREEDVRGGEAKGARPQQQMKIDPAKGKGKARAVEPLPVMPTVAAGSQQGSSKRRKAVVPVVRVKKEEDLDDEHEEELARAKKLEQELFPAFATAAAAGAAAQKEEDQTKMQMMVGDPNQVEFIFELDEGAEEGYLPEAARHPVVYDDDEEEGGQLEEYYDDEEMEREYEYSMEDAQETYDSEPHYDDDNDESESEHSVRRHSGHQHANNPEQQASPSVSLLPTVSDFLSSLSRPLSDLLPAFTDQGVLSPADLWALSGQKRLRDRVFGRIQDLRAFERDVLEVGLEDLRSRAIMGM